MTQNHLETDRLRMIEVILQMEVRLATVRLLLSSFIALVFVPIITFLSSITYKLYSSWFTYSFPTRLASFSSHFPTSPIHHFVPWLTLMLFWDLYSSLSVVSTFPLHFFVTFIPFFEQILLPGRANIMANRWLYCKKSTHKRQIFLSRVGSHLSIRIFVFYELFWEFYGWANVRSDGDAFQKQWKTIGRLPFYPLFDFAEYSWASVSKKYGSQA